MLTMRGWRQGGHARRVLEWKGNQVVHVITITDVGHLTSDMDQGEDQLELASEREHSPHRRGQLG